MTGLWVSFLWQMMADILGSCCPITLKLKSSIKRKSFIKSTIKIHDFKRKLKLLLFQKRLLIGVSYQVKFVLMKFFYTWNIGVQLTQKVLRDHQAVQAKTTWSPSFPEVPVKCTDRQESRKSPQCYIHTTVKRWLIEISPIKLNFWINNQWRSSEKALSIFCIIY